MTDRKGHKNLSFNRPSVFLRHILDLFLLSLRLFTALRGVSIYNVRFKCEKSIEMAVNYPRSVTNSLKHLLKDRFFGPLQSVTSIQKV